MPTITERGTRDSQSVPDHSGLKVEKARPSVGLAWERALPWIAALGPWVVTLYLPSAWILNAAWKESLLDKVVSACSIFVAYLATAVTVIPAVEDKSIIRRLKEWGYLRFIVKYLSDALWASGLLLLLCLLAVPLPKGLNESALFNSFFSAFWWGTFFFTVAAVIRAVRILVKTLLAN